MNLSLVVVLLVIVFLLGLTSGFSISFFIVLKGNEPKVTMEAGVYSSDTGEPVSIGENNNEPVPGGVIHMTPEYEKTIESRVNN